MNCFKYDETMDETELPNKVEELLEWMRTDEYWVQRGGNGPMFDEGGELMRKYLDYMDRRGEERTNALIVPYNLICRANSAKPKLIDRTTTGCVSVVMMSGREIPIRLEQNTDILSIKTEVAKAMFENHKIKTPRITLLNGTELVDNDSRLIITDDTILTVVINTPKHRK